MQVIPGWDFVPILCYSDVNPGCQVLTYSLPPMWSVLQSQERIFWYFLVPFLVPKSHQNLKHFLTSFLSYRVTHFILSFNCTKHTSLNHKLLKKNITGQKMSWPALLKQALRSLTHTHTHIHSRTHLVPVSNAFPYIFFPFILTHNSLFIPSKSGTARPQSPRPNRPMNRNMSSA